MSEFEFPQDTGYALARMSFDLCQNSPVDTIQAFKGVWS
jgi:hypothetical protein